MYKSEELSCPRPPLITQIALSILACEFILILRRNCLDKNDFGLDRDNGYLRRKLHTCVLYEYNSCNNNNNTILLS